MLKTKTPPEIGARVTWIDPESDQRNTQFIRNHIDKYGSDGLTVRNHREMAGQIFVTLNKDGKPVSHKTWDTEPVEINWNFLRPVVE